MLDPWTTLNCGGKLLSLETPIVMGILNVTPDSFYDGGKHDTNSAILSNTKKMIAEGATIIDVGGMSSRPGAKIIPLNEELARVLPTIEIIRTQYPETIISIDTVRAEVAKQAIKAGATIINDISAGRIDPQMYTTVAELDVPYILMHMKGQPENMQQSPSYTDIVLDVLDFFISEVGKLRKLGVKDLIIDPGFGFGKTLEHNYQLLKKLHVFQILGLPILTGISRKSMIYKLLDLPPEAALNGTTALHMIALQQGSKILRAHDVKEAMEVIRLWQQMEAIG